MAVADITRAVAEAEAVPDASARTGGQRIRTENRRRSQFKQVCEKAIETEKPTQMLERVAANSTSRTDYLRSVVGTKHGIHRYRAGDRSAVQDDEYWTAESSSDEHKPRNTMNNVTQSSEVSIREPSPELFSSSRSASRNGSTSSLSSFTSDVDFATPSRKRTLDYVFPLSPVSPSPIVKRTRQTDMRSTTERGRKPAAPATPQIDVPSPKATGSRTVTRSATMPEPPKTSATPIRRSRTLSVIEDALSDTYVTPQDGVVIIAHSGTIQKLMDDMRIAWGVQYELARGVCREEWAWHDVTKSKLEQLTGPNTTAAPRVPSVMNPGSISRPSAMDAALWAELDREQAALETDPLRGLGLKGEWQGEPKWYGGRIQQVARLVKEQNGSYSVRLEKMLKRKSNRFARFLGSRRMLQVSVSDNLVRAETQRVRELFAQRFVLCGRVFVPFAAKDGKVFMMEINEEYQRKPNHPEDHGRISLGEFLQWHNPIKLNSHQPTSKWITRFDLGLSTSVPVLQFHGIDNDIFYIPDQVVSSSSRSGKAPAKDIFTDGCGFMNGAALSQIGRSLGFTERPTVVQGRFAGTKGLWALHPEDRALDEIPRIWIRPSQEKIKYDALDPAKLIFDLVAPPRVTVPSRLSSHAIMNLSHNGVPDGVFISLMRSCLQREMDSLTTWTGPNDTKLLWHAVNQIGHVTGTRLRDYATGGARVLGLGRAQDREDWNPDDSGDLPEDEEDGSVFVGDPPSAHAAVMELLQAGFHPLKLGVLYDKLRDVAKQRIMDIIKEYHIAVPLSAEAFIIPDPIGVLEEGQIHFKSSQNLKDPVEDSMPMILSGDVLIYRNPARVPSDIRKVTAVAHPALADYTNVIVLPVKGNRSLANILAGGDVDGDVCVCIYDQNIVNHFTNSAVNDPPPDFEHKNFDAEDGVKLLDLDKCTYGSSSRDDFKVVQKVLLSGLSDTPVGLYSTFHENSAYVHGYDDVRTLYNAFMFTTVLDSRKTGLTVKRDVFEADKKRYMGGRPSCMSYDQKPYDQTNRLVKRRCSAPFVLDQLVSAGKALETEHLKRLDIQRNRVTADPDPDLLRPFEGAKRLAEEMKRRGFSAIAEEMGLIENHVNAVLKEWIRLSGRSRNEPSLVNSQGESHSKAKASNTRAYRDLARSLLRGPENVQLLAQLPGYDAIITSCAYSSTYLRNPRFAFSLVLRTLCVVKADSNGRTGMDRGFVETMSISSTAVKILAQTS
ncbi:hypothetical protein WOLCODRAFT_135643 [Wolfiporia cocos MD-104 SS10]|uniref:RNA-dependent RNA polymerase n=1 Tax=Wolfiporia cocos (strain MD-104) TaxID=742152 RepID=A0A2H3IY02_WOLCO|nr:hypothetical protein WOLCODRAFT_135643 [Wolfiporia cocos MD-104 SS10]